METEYSPETLVLLLGPSEKITALDSRARPQHSSIISLASRFSQLSSDGKKCCAHLSGERTKHFNTRRFSLPTARAAQVSCSAGATFSSNTALLTMSSS